MLTMERVAVVALGDLARSPRMLNHARSLARRGNDVALIGYVERPLNLPAGIRVHALHPIRRGSEEASGLRFLAGASLRMGLLFFELTICLLLAKPQSILIQNAPSFPTMIAAWIAGRLCGARVIVDWHNYAYTILALRLTPAHAIVSVSTWYEFFTGRKCDAHLCVSRGLQHDLAAHGIDAKVLYDRPAVYTSGRPSGNPFVAVCPCSWTADDDIGMLLDALQQMPPSKRTLEVHLTGDGPLRESFQARIAEMPVDIRTGYLSESDYRALLERADLGLSPHHSSSGLDLAMKVSDLFAARVPVCAWNYGGSLPEQVIDGVNGFLFRDAAELSAILARLLDDPTPLAVMRENIARDWTETWDEAWEKAWV